MSKKVVLTIEDSFYQDFKAAFGRPGKPMTQIILDKMYELLSNDMAYSDQFYEHIDNSIKEVERGEAVSLGECRSGKEVIEKLGI